MTSNSSSEQPSADVTGLLKKLMQGDPEASAAIAPMVYLELRRIARAYMRDERASHTLQPTALIHEAWMRLTDQTRVTWRDRTHFFGVAASMMRRVLVDHARHRLAGKRGAGQTPLTLQWIDIDDGGEKMSEVLAVHEALEKLNKIDPRQTQIVEMLYFAGMNVDETAAALDVSPRTVDREWSMARAWLQGQFAGKNAAG
jgi:RNA polymerase sigma-70 factor (ECF subfamily)